MSNRRRRSPRSLIASPVGGVATLFLLNGVVLGSWLPRLPEIRDRLGMSLAAVGFTLAVGNVGGLLGSGISGRLVGRFGARAAAIHPAGLVLALLPLIAFAPNPVALAAAVFAIAIADAVADVGMNALAVRLQEVRSRSVFTRLHGLWSIGTLVGAAVSTGAIALGIGLGPQLVGTAVVSLIALAAASRVLPATDRRPRPRPHYGVAFALALAGGAAALVEGTPSDWSAIFLTDVLDASAAVAGAGFVAVTLGMLVGRLGGDGVVDRVGPRRSLHASLALVAASTILTVTAGSVVLAMIGFILWGLGVSVILPLLYRLAGSHPGFGEGSGLAALTLGSRIGFLAGPAAVGAVAEAAGLPWGVFTVVTAGVAFAFLTVRSLQH
jgi:MFS family permease